MKVNFYSVFAVKVWFFIFCIFTVFCSEVIVLFCELAGLKKGMVSGEPNPMWVFVMTCFSVPIMVVGPAEFEHFRG